MSYYLIIYFFVGVVQDFLVTMNWRFVAKDQPMPAVIFSFLTTVVSFSVLYNILTKLDTQKSVIAIIIYALGIATGTFIAMKFNLSKKSPRPPEFWI